MNKNSSNEKRSPLKDRQSRYPGQSLENEINDLSFEIGILVGLSSIFIILASLEWWRWYRNLPPKPIVFGIVATVVVVYSSLRIWRIRKRRSSCRLGLIGEREVGQIINKLIAQGYTVLHDVWNGKFNIDHVVVSPHGIFAIETKTYSKPGRGKAEVRFDGKQVTLTGHSPDAKPVMEAVRHAGWLRKTLGIKDSSGKLFMVKPVVVYPGWYYKDTGHNKDIWVLHPEMLEVQIARELISLTEADIAIAKARLEPYSTTPTDDLFE